MNVNVNVKKMSNIPVNICRSFYLKRLTSPTNYLIGRLFSSENDKPLSPKMQEFKRKLKQTSPIGQLEEQPFDHPAQEKEPLKPWPNNTNPHTGEINGPKGPEPTRYGDWERKGRVSDF